MTQCFPAVTRRSANLQMSCDHTRGVVSVIVPTLNSEAFVEKCLFSIKNQSYPDVEIIVVDGFSRDRTVEIARKYASKVYQFGPEQSRGTVFGAPYQRNFGARKSIGEFIYYVDVDMELSRDLVASCVREVTESDFEAAIIPEVSRGRGFWSACKSLERSCYVGDDFAEAPRFFIRSVWEKLNGLDPQVGADDWDLYHRFKHAGFKAVRVTSFVIHDEGSLTLRKLIVKRYVYGKQIHKFLSRYGVEGYVQFFPLRRSYFRNRQLFVHDPVHALGTMVMRAFEYSAGAVGLIAGRITSSETSLLERESS